MNGLVTLSQTETQERPPLSLIRSPYRTETFMFCPAKSYLQTVEHLELVSSRSLIARVVGSALAEGSALIHKWWAGQGTSEPPNHQCLVAAKQRALQYFNLYIAHLGKSGITIEPSSYSQKPIEIARVLERYSEALPLRGYQILDVERELPNHGRCKIDLGVVTPGGDLAVIDFKYKSNLAQEYRQRTVSRYLRSFQFQMYPWAYSEYSQKPVPLMYLLLVVFRPGFNVSLIPQEVCPEYQQVWLKSAHQVWKDMAEVKAGTRQLTVNPTHEDNYGLCEMAGVCLDNKMDVEAAVRSGLYARVGKFDFEAALAAEELVAA